jgi:hypothetical protein
MAKKKYILKVDRDYAYFSGQDNLGSMIFKKNIKDATVFHTKKEAQEWLKFTGGEILEKDDGMKTGKKKKK